MWSNNHKKSTNQSKQSQKTEVDAVNLGKTCDQLQITQQVERRKCLALALEPHNTMKKHACNQCQAEK